MNASDDLLTKASRTTGKQAADGDPDATARTTGILPSQDLKRLARTTREIRSLEPIQDDQYQPASLDLRLGSVA